MSYVLDDVIEILRAGQNKKLLERRRIRASVVDDFLFSGRFNSVLGLEGFRIFKVKLRPVVSRVNDDDFGPDLVTPTHLFEALLASGVHYADDHRPSELAFLGTDARWLTAYRFVAKHLSNLSSSDFAVMATRFNETRGHSMYLEPSDAESLRALADSHLFEVVADAKAALMRMPLRELRVLCRAHGIAAARSIDETAARIVEKCGADRRSFVLRDQDLATGDDVIRLDTALRAMAKAMRDDLIRFVVARRQSVVGIRPGTLT